MAPIGPTSKASQALACTSVCLLKYKYRLGPHRVEATCRRRAATSISCAELCATSGISRNRIAIVGFSQGAYLSSEYLARNPDRYWAMIAFTGGLISTRWIMSDHDEIERLERQIAEDEARVLELTEIERTLLANISHHGFQTAISERNPEGEQHMPHDSLFRNRQRLHDLER